MPLAQLRILVAIDQNMFTNGLRELFHDDSGLPVCSIINCTHHLLQEYNVHKSDIALFDLNSPRINGKEAIKRILKVFPNAKLIMLSLYVDRSLIKQVKEAGVKGHLEDGSKLYQFVENVRALTTGDEYQVQHNQYLIDDSGAHLSNREVEVLRLIADGHTNPEIARVLKIRPETAKGYRKTLIEKLNVRNTAELVAKAIRQGLIYLL
jgi:DNA-binding NarL/FixJ family response regulator